MDYYEERYRLAGRGALGLAVVCLAIGLGFVLLRLPLFCLPIATVIVVLAGHGAGLIDLARRKVAFRADHAGIMLGAVPDKLTVRRGSALFIPWDDVESIVLYRVCPRGRGRPPAVPCIGIQRRPGAKPLLWGNEQAPGCPVPRVPAWVTRRIAGWRLDRDRLATVATALAPGVAILDAWP